MPTYTQLNAEAAWRAEFMTEPMKWFCAHVAAGLGIPAANVGAKGDNLHLNGGHRSQRWILSSRYCTNRTYTVWKGLPAHLMDALGAVDITPKSREQMLLISRRLDVAARAGQIEEVVAWYGNTNDDARVDGWDNIRNAVASSDSSHLWHVHLTFNRWAVGDRPMFERLAAILLGTPTPEGDDDMAEWLPPEQGGSVHAWTAAKRIEETVNVVRQVKADVEELKNRPAGTVALTPTDRDAMVVGLVAGLAGSPGFLAAVAKAVADEHHRRQKD